MRAAQDPDSMALTTFASATSSGRWIWQENKKNQGSKRKPFLVRSRLYCRGRLTLFAFDASLLSAMLRNMLLATAEEANAAAAVSGLCWAGWLAGSGNYQNTFSSFVAIYHKLYTGLQCLTGPLYCPELVIYYLLPETYPDYPPGATMSDLSRGTSTSFCDRSRHAGHGLELLLPQRA